MKSLRNITFLLITLSIFGLISCNSDEQVMDNFEVPSPQFQHNEVIPNGINPSAQVIF